MPIWHEQPRTLCRGGPRYFSHMDQVDKVDLQTHSHAADRVERRGYGSDRSYLPQAATLVCSRSAERRLRPLADPLCNRVEEFGVLRICTGVSR